MSDLIVTRFVSSRQPTVAATVAHRIATVRIALRTYLTRQALPDLTARELADIGLTRHAAVAEAARLPWDTNPGPRRPGQPSLVRSILQAWQRARTRRLLVQMTAHELRDIGVTPTDAETEANKPFWRG